MKRARSRRIALALVPALATGCSEREAPAAPEAATPAAEERPLSFRTTPPPGSWHERTAAALERTAAALERTAAALERKDATLDPATLSEADRALVAQLEAIGYVAGSRPAPSEKNVTRYDRDRAYDGFNLMTSGHDTEALLLDMEGRVLHRWAADFDTLYPESPIRPTHPQRHMWRRTALTPNGDLFVIFEGTGIARLDAASRPIWASDVKAHHDLEVQPDGSLYVLTRRVAIRPGFHRGRPFLEDFITVLDAAGQVVRQVSILDALLDSPYGELYEGKTNAKGDIFHTNTLAVLPPGPGVRPPGFTPGRVLVAIPMLDATALVDLDERRVVWAHRGHYRYHHDPTLLASGRLLIFDNNGNEGRSRVLELDPATGEIVWQYAGTPEQPLDSATCSTAQRLPNGNTLITESEAGRALEITVDGETVWEYLSPFRAGERGELVATLFEMRRLPPSFPIDWARLSEPGAR